MSDDFWDWLLIEYTLELALFDLFTTAFILFWVFVFYLDLRDKYRQSRQKKQSELRKLVEEEVRKQLRDDTT